MELDSRAYIKQKLSELRNLYNQRAERAWLLYTRKATVSYSDLDQQVQRILSDSHLWQAVEDCLAAPESEAERRLVALVKQHLVANAITVRPEVAWLHDRLLSVHANTRPVVHGQSVSAGSLYRTVRSNPDRDARRAAWEALGQISEAASADLKAYLAALNAAAAEWGYPTYYDFILSENDSDSDFLAARLEEYRNGSDESAREVYEILEALLETAPEPWDWYYLRDAVLGEVDQYYLAERAYPSLVETLGSVGFHVDQLPVRVDAEPREDKVQGAFFFAVKSPHDVRISVNPLPGRDFYHDLYHEFGHALYLVFNERQELIHRLDGIYFAEGLAEVIAGLINEPEWLERYTDLTPGQIARFAAYQKLAIFDRRQNLVRVAFEMEAYRSPSGDLDCLYRSAWEKYSLLPWHDVHRWALPVLMVSHPGHLAGSFLANLISAQILSHLRDEGGSLFRPATGEYLVESFYRPGRSLPWPERLAKATGRPLSAGCALPR